MSSSKNTAKPHVFNVDLPLTREGVDGMLTEWPSFWVAKRRVCSRAVEWRNAHRERNAGFWVQSVCQFRYAGEGNL